MKHQGNSTFKKQLNLERHIEVYYVHRIGTFVHILAWSLYISLINTEGKVVLQDYLHIWYLCDLSFWKKKRIFFFVIPGKSLPCRPIVWASLHHGSGRQGWGLLLLATKLFVQQTMKRVKRHANYLVIWETSSMKKGFFKVTDFAFFALQYYESEILFSFVRALLETLKRKIGQIYTLTYHF